MDHLQSAGPEPFTVAQMHFLHLPHCALHLGYNFTVRQCSQIPYAIMYHNTILKTTPEVETLLQHLYASFSKR